MMSMKGTIIFLLFQNIQVSSQLGNNGGKSSFNVNHKNLNFIILGDWGGDSSYPYTTDIQRNLAEGTNKVAKENNVDFYVSTGDHFYPRGVKNVDDPRFKTTFEDAFNKTGHQKKWHLVPGNHDYYSNISAQIAYTQKSSRWHFPQFYYSVSYYSESKLIADFVMTDTIMLCGSTAGTPDEKPRGPTDVVAANAQWKWIEETLNSSRAPYLFIVGHYPPRSKGRHGPTTECFVNKVENLMRKYQVTAYVAGHDHNMQHYRFVNSSTEVYDYIVAGLGAMYNDIQSTRHDPRGKILFFYPNTTRNAPAVLKETNKGGFVLASLTKSWGNFTFYNGDSTILYNFTVPPRKII